jgi:glycosyltransferase involved in cell wall biosynthesis
MSLGLDNGGNELEQSWDVGRIVRFLYIGGIAYHKGVHVILDAFRQLHDEAELWIAGDGEDQTYIDLLHELANSSVRFLGHLSRAEVWEKLSQVSVVLVPSLSPETFCLVIQEAFAAGVPVIVSRIGAMIEAVEHGKDGLLVEPGNVEAWYKAMRFVVDEPTQLTEMKTHISPPPNTADYAVRMLALYGSVLVKGGS